MTNGCAPPRTALVQDIGLTLYDESTHDTRFDSLRRELDEAFAQASAGKGMERHGDDGPFEDQINVRIARELGPAFPVGQAVKKLIEGLRMYRDGSTTAAIREWHGAVVYACMAIIVARKRR